MLRRSALSLALTLPFTTACASSHLVVQAKQPTLAFIGCAWETGATPDGRALPPAMLEKAEALKTEPAPRIGEKSEAPPPRGSAAGHAPSRAGAAARAAAMAVDEDEVPRIETVIPG